MPKVTSYEIVAVTAVGTTDFLEHQAMVYDKTAGLPQDRVKPSTGAAGEVFAGCSNVSGKAGQSLGLIQIGKANPKVIGDVAQGDVLKLAAGGALTKSADGTLKVAVADSNTVDGQRVTASVGF